VETTQVYEEVFPDRDQAPKITCHVLADTSNAPKALAAYAKAEAVDLVCIGTRGLGAFRRSMYSLVGLGSVSDWLVHNSECPVLVCKLPPEHVPAVTPTPDRCAHGTLSNNRRATECVDSVLLDNTAPWSKAEFVCSQAPLHACPPPSQRRIRRHRRLHVRRMLPVVNDASFSGKPTSIVRLAHTPPTLWRRS
jgi:hypothetical protein